MNSYTSNFVADAKLQDINKISEWDYRWEMESNQKKCKVTEFGNSAKRVKGNNVLNE